MHVAMHAFSSHVEVLNKVTPIEPLGQSATLMSARNNAFAGTIYTFINPVYGNQNHMAQAITAVQNDTLGRTYKSAPTVRGYFFNKPE